MYAISDNFTTYLQERSREWLVKANIAGTDYDNSVIVDFEIENSLALGEEFEIGTAILSKLTIRLKTTDEIAPNAKVIPYVAITLPASLDGANAAWEIVLDTWEGAAYPWQGAVTEWLPLGEFYVDSRERINGIWTYTCYDKLVYADVPYTSALTYPATMQAVWNEICTSLSYTSDASVDIDASYTVSSTPSGYSKRQMLGYIASANSASVYVGKNGVLKFRKFNVDDDRVFEFSDREYIQATQTNPSKTYTKIVVTYDTDNELTYEAGTGDEDHTLYLTNPFMTQTMVNDLLTQLNGYTYVPATMDARGYPQIEAGDRVRFGQAAETLTWEEADTPWEDTAYSWDSYLNGGHTLALHSVYSFKGGLKMSVEAPSKSDQKSEFDVEGPLTSSVKDIRKNAIRTDKTYFGVSITDDDGIIVERSDHASELIINSDVLLDWTVGGVHKLYYDADDDAIKFTGIIDASSFVGGTIEIGSGNNVFKADANGIYLGNATFALAPFRVTPLGSLVATDADVEGHITATSGSIAGWTIEADKLSGSGAIEGGTITGAKIQTDAAGTYPRIELSSVDNLMTASLDADTSIAINPDITGSPGFVFTAAGMSALLSIALTTILFSNFDGPISISGTTVDLNRDGGDTRVADWASLVNYDTSQTLQQALDAKASSFTGRTGSALVKASDGTTNLELVFSNGICTAINVL